MQKLNRTLIFKYFVKTSNSAEANECWGLQETLSKTERVKGKVEADWSPFHQLFDPCWQPSHWDTISFA